MRNKPFVDRYLRELESMIKRISQEDIDRVIELLYGAWRDQGQVQKA